MLFKMKEKKSGFYINIFTLKIIFQIIFKTKISCMLKDYAADQGIKLSKKEQEILWKEVEDSLNKIKVLFSCQFCNNHNK